MRRLSKINAKSNQFLKKSKRDADARRMMQATMRRAASVFAQFKKEEAHD